MIGNYIEITEEEFPLSLENTEVIGYDEIELLYYHINLIKHTVEWEEPRKLIYLFDKERYHTGYIYIYKIGCYFYLYYADEESKYYKFTLE